MTDMNNLQQDTDSIARNRIVTEINRNFFVEAGAGSGKTTMLVNRMVAMVENEIDISKICTITFTKAAANEFYERFQNKLIERSVYADKWKDEGTPGQLPRPTEITKQRCAKALENINLCFMGTIDSFCQMILAEHPYEAGIPSDTRIITKEEEQAFYKQQYSRICAGRYDNENLSLSSLAGTFNRLYRNPEEVFVQGISFLMERRNVTFQCTPSTAADLDRELASDRDDLKNFVKFLKDHSDALKYKTETKNQKAWKRINDIYNTFSAVWSENFSRVWDALQILQNIRLVGNANDLVEDADQEFIDMFEPGGKQGKWLELPKNVFYNYFTRLREQQYSVTMTFLKECTPVIAQAMREKGNLTYFDYLYYLRNMLCDYETGKVKAKLIQHIYGRHSYFLIDEFQDTNPLQAEVFFYLTAEQPKETWSDCMPKPGSLFIVGDPKQSIYRFRSADVAAFNRVKNLFAKQDKENVLELTRNFRSTRTLCEYYNKVFETMFPEEPANQSKFKKIPLPDRLNEFSNVYTYNAYEDEVVTAFRDKADKDKQDKATDAYKKVKTDSEQIVKIIEALINQNEFQITTEKDSAPRPIQYKDFMVITSVKDDLSPIMARLHAHGIPVKVEGMVRFEVNQALSEVYRIYAAVADSRDKAALYGALTGRLIGLSEKEIIIFKNNGGELSLRAKFDKEKCQDNTAIKVATKIEQLKYLHRAAQKLSPAALFSKILDDYKVYQTVAAENLEVLYYSLELIRNGEKTAKIISLKDGRNFIADLLAGNSEEERCLSLKDNSNRVRLANLHKVKGLEAPIVILAAAPVKTIPPSYRIEHNEDRAEGYIFSLGKKLPNGRFEVYFETANYAMTKQENEKKDGQAENDRLVYVAATRARNVLIFCKEIYYDANAQNPVSTKWASLQQDDVTDIFDTIKSIQPSRPGQKESVTAEDLYEEAEDSCALNDRSKEKPTYEIVRPSSLAVSKLDSGQEGTVETELPEQDDTKEKNDAAGQTDLTKTEERKKFAALLGTMVHKLMEFLVTTKNQMEPEELIGEIMREFITPDLEKFEKDIKADLTKVAETMRNGGYKQTNGLPQDLLQTLLHADEVYCEVPYCYKEEKGNDTDNLWNGTMDVVYRSGDKWHIVDYKTNADGNDLDERYKEQLKAYQKAFKEIEDDDADALTYHIDV